VSALSVADDASDAFFGIVETHASEGCGDKKPKEGDTA
jgi:hypothetical protein